MSAGERISIQPDCMEHLIALVQAGFTDWKQYGEVYTKEQGNLILFNYTPAAQYANTWTWLERVSRGLILNRVTGEIVARPFDKFYNWGENGRYPSPGATIVSVTEKMDGSLGIFYRDNGYKIATRGSFDSPQAKWATAFLNSERFNLLALPDDLTLLFEIIYPDNRVVVDYGRRESLVLLAARRRHSGIYLQPSILPALAGMCGFDVPQQYDFRDMQNLLATTPEIQHEGYVVLFSDGSRWKVKGDQYRALHRIISHISFNAVLDALSIGAYDVYRASIPEEFWTEIDGYAVEIQNMVAETDRIIRALPADFPTRKDAALWIQQQPRQYQGLFFKHYDGKYSTDAAYKLIERRRQALYTDRGEA